MNTELPKINQPFEPPRLPFPWVTWTIVISTVAVFLGQLATVYFFHRDIVADKLSFYPEAMAEGRYYTVLTYAWIHATEIFDSPWFFWLHVVSNMVPLLLLGPALEDILGHWKYLFLYVGGAVAAAVVFHLANPHNLDPIEGASGAVYAVLAGIGTAVPNERVIVLLFLVVPMGRLRLWMVVSVVCALELIQQIFHIMPEVAHWAHLGGAFFGFVYVMALRLYYRRSNLPQMPV